MSDDLNEYEVTWIIDVWAKDPLNAARCVHEIHLDPESLAVVFMVKDKKTKTTSVIDLDKEDGCQK